jgi:DNA (cytosine-5)-methyltransferase 1
MIATLPGFQQRVTALNPSPRDHEWMLDSFAGAGGWSVGAEAATGYAVNHAINHDPTAIATHAINHPATEHHVTDVFEIDPHSIEPARPLGYAHFSPDCTHHSKARGCAPVSDRVRGLAWVVVWWAWARRPRVITLENVEEFRDWGPTEAGKVIKERKGEGFEAFIAVLTTGLSPEHPAWDEIRQTIPAVPPSVLEQGLGYDVEYRELRACDFGAPTTRRRFFLIARCDGRPIRWPEPTHGPGRLPYHTAAECIDWGIACPSIFLTREEARRLSLRCKRPLADATMRRIAAGVDRHVLNSPQPFVVPIQHYGSHNSGHPISEPLRTITAWPRGGAFALATPYLIPRYGEREGQAPRHRSVDRPMPTVTPTANGAQLVSALLTRHYGGMVGQDLRKPCPTITGRDSNAITAAHLINLRGTARDGHSLNEPLRTITAGGNHAGLVAAFMINYYSQGSGLTGSRADRPIPTITTKGRQAVVTVQIAGEDYVIADIGMRMLEPHELLRAQFGPFADSYVLTGTKTQKVAAIGNSVCPQVAEAIVAANVRLRARETVEVAA